MKVMITKGAMTGKTGTAVPIRAIGPINNRTFLVLITFDDGSGFYEVPTDAIKSI
jgi:hypothetical protein